MFVQVGEEIGTISELKDSVETVSAAEVSLKSIIKLSELSQRAGGAIVTMARLSKVTGVASMVLQTLQDQNQWKL